MAEIKKAEKSELNGLVRVYKEIFSAHNVFVGKNETEILNYLQKAYGEAEKNNSGFIIAIAENAIVGGLLLVREETAGRHARWRIKHFGVLPNYYGKGLRTELLETAEQYIKESIEEGKIDSVKIEIKSAETENEDESWYKQHGFELEGDLPNHYRMGERCFIFGRTLKKGI